MAQAMITQRNASKQIQIAQCPKTTPNVKLLKQQLKAGYWKGTYANAPVVAHAPSGYINASKFCKDFGKMFRIGLETNRQKQLLPSWLCMRMWTHNSFLLHT